MANDKKITAIALFRAVNLHDEGLIKDRQNCMRQFAERHHANIASFLMIEDGFCAEGVEHAIKLAQQQGSSLLVVDSEATISLSFKSLLQFFEIMVNIELCLGFMDSKAYFNQAALKSLCRILRSGIEGDFDQRSQSIKKSLQAVKQKGKKLGGKPFGVNSQQTLIIQQIIKLHKQGFSLQKICDLLSVYNIKTTLNKTWHPTTVKRIIERNSVSRSV